MKLSTLWNIVSGKPYPVQQPDGRITKYSNFRQYLNHLRGKSFTMEFPDNQPEPDLDTLRKGVAENPSDLRARHFLAAHLLTAGSLDEAYSEYLEVIAQLSSDQTSKANSLGPGQLGLAHYQTAQVLEQMGRDADARWHWQACADVWQSLVPDKKDLHEIRYYTDAMEKLK